MKAAYNPYKAALCATIGALRAVGNFDYRPADRGQACMFMHRSRTASSRAAMSVIIVGFPYQVVRLALPEAGSWPVSAVSLRGLAGLCDGCGVIPGFGRFDRRC